MLVKIIDCTEEMIRCQCSFDVCSFFSPINKRVFFSFFYTTANTMILKTIPSSSVQHLLGDWEGQHDSKLTLQAPFYSVIAC